MRMTVITLSFRSDIATVRLMEKHTYPTEAAPVPFNSTSTFEHDVHDALRALPRGSEIARYFGIGTDNRGQQSDDEIHEAEQILGELQTSVRAGMSIEPLLPKMAAHSKGYGLDPEALRSLMYRR